jgi:hypothetical protein
MTTADGELISTADKHVIISDRYVIMYRRCIMYIFFARDCYSRMDSSHCLGRTGGRGRLMHASIGMDSTVPLYCEDDARRGSLPSISGNPLGILLWPRYRYRYRYFVVKRRINVCTGRECS